MRLSRHRSLAGVLLALLFLGGNFGLPVADALLFHSLPGAAAPQKTTVGKPGTEAGHPQLCLQLKATGQAQSIPGSGTPIARLTHDAVGPVLAAPSAVVTSPAPSCQFSRAPPSEPARG